MSTPLRPEACSSHLSHLAWSVPFVPGPPADEDQTLGLDAEGRLGRLTAFRIRHGSDPGVGPCCHLLGALFRLLVTYDLTLALARSPGQLPSDG